MTIQLFNTKTYEVYNHAIGEHSIDYNSKEELGIDKELFLSTPSADDVSHTTFTIVFDMEYPGIDFRYTIPVHTLGDFINGWNALVILRQDKHVLFMKPDWSNPEYIFMVNATNRVMHLYGCIYFGRWEPFEVKRLHINSFSYIAEPIVTYETPIVVKQDIPLFDLTAYIYRKKDAGYYVKTETLVMKAGFYSCMDTFIAQLNYCIKMRGERNGYIYHFIKGKEFMTLAVEAAHRQPDPSYIDIMPLNPSLGFLDRTSLQLRTRKREYGCVRIAYVM